MWTEAEETDSDELEQKKEKGAEEGGRIQSSREVESKA